MQLQATAEQYIKEVSPFLSSFDSLYASLYYVAFDALVGCDPYFIVLICYHRNRDQNCEQSWFIH